MADTLSRPVAASHLVRHARSADLPALEALYDHLTPDRPRLANGRAQAILDEILASPACRLFVCEVEGELVATCMLALLPDLLLGGQPHAFLENVVAHPHHRRMGYGQAVVCAALQAAWDAGARHVLLMSSRPDPGVRHFYEGCGFAVGVKTGYVAWSPTAG